MKFFKSEPKLATYPEALFEDFPTAMYDKFDSGHCFIWYPWM